jgi:hypothetical protein
VDDNKATKKPDATTSTTSSSGNILVSIEACKQ